MLETPRSKRTASAPRPLSANRSSTSAKSPARNRVFTPARRRNDSKYGLTLGSLSIATYLPSPFRSSASTSVPACPEGGVDHRVPRLHVEQAPNLFGEDGT